MKSETSRRIIDELAESLDISKTAYDKADERYKSVGAWLDRPQSKCYKYSPHIYAQGSFRLGTVVRPIDENAEYDLDMGCRLRNGVTKDTHTQEQLKNLLGDDLKDYRIAKGIEKPVEPKHRCWRLAYKDQMNFHLDAVPSIPENFTTRFYLKERMIGFGIPDHVANVVSQHAGNITDDACPITVSSAQTGRSATRKASPSGSNQECASPQAASFRKERL